MSLEQKSIVIFDLDDTLAESKQVMSQRIADLLEQLSRHVHVAIISGCAKEQFLDQVVGTLSDWLTKDRWSKFFFLPTSGTQCFYYPDGDARAFTLWEEKLPLRVKVFIWNAFHAMLERFPKVELGYHGEIAEDRVSQITFSLMGQEAPIEVKRSWAEKYGQIRYAMAQNMMEDQLLKSVGLEVRVGGTTSLDVTRANRDKAYGVSELMSHLSLATEEVLFVGDKLMPGGNDFPVTTLGVDVIPVESVEDTRRWLEVLLNDSNQT